MDLELILSTIRDIEKFSHLVSGLWRNLTTYIGAEKDEKKRKELFEALVVHNLDRIRELLFK